MLSNTSVRAQNDLTVTKVIYKTGIYNSHDHDSRIKEATKTPYEKVRAIEKQLQYELIFDGTFSLFKLSEINSRDSLSNYVILAEGFKEKIYHDKSTQETTRFTTLNDVDYKYVLDHANIQWKISKAYKYIMGFKCFKATTQLVLLHPITQQKNVFYPVVWFTYALPYAYGPHLFNGLPGLILEATYNGKSYFRISEIEFNSSKKIEGIDKLEKAIETSEYSYNSVLVKKFKSRRINQDH